MLPWVRWMMIFEKRGLPSTSSARPGISGYIPIADQTYQEDISPRSSLPGMPFGELVHIVFRTLRIASCALQGSPRKSNSQGDSMDGSLFSSAWSGPDLVTARLLSGL